MILFDTSVIIDAKDPQSPWHLWAEQQIALATSSEGAVVDPIVLAEACIKVDDPAGFPKKLEEMGIVIADLPSSTAVRVAAAYSLYLQRRKAEGQRGPKTPLPDFFIGAHAEIERLKLATRDPDRIKTYFPAVAMITP